MPLNWIVDVGRPRELIALQGHSAQDKDAPTAYSGSKSSLSSVISLVLVFGLFDEVQAVRSFTKQSPAGPLPLARDRAAVLPSE